jgi:hypothetical protein
MNPALARRSLHRRSTATTAAVVVVLAGALSSCGFEEPTDRVNTIAAGVNNRDASVDALGIRVLSAEPGQGRIIGALANNGADDAALVAVDGDATAAEFEPIEVPGGGRVNLAAAETTPIPMTGDFVAGQVVELTFTFEAEGTEQVTLDVPVVKNCFQYTDVPEVEESESPEAGADGEDAAAEEAEESVEDPAYICEHPTDDAEH